MEKPQDAGGREARVREPQPPGLSHLSAGDPRPERPLWAQGAYPRSTGVLGAAVTHFYKLNPWSFFRKEPEMYTFPLIGDFIANERYQLRDGNILIFPMKPVVN